MRGRKPKPSWLKLIEGNPGRRPLNPNEPVPKDPLSAAPDDFSPEQRVIWDHAFRCAPPGLLTELDRQCMITYCVAADLHRQAREKIKQFGALVKAPITQVPIQSPWLAIMNKQATIMAKCTAEMGFTPSSRSRVHVERSPPADSTGVFDDLQELPGDERR